MPLDSSMIRTSGPGGSQCHQELDATETGTGENCKLSRYLSLIFEQFSLYLSLIFLDTWYPEILAVIVAVGGWCSILSVLLVYHGQPLANWTYSISLNTVLSSLATIMKVALLYPVTSSLGQLRWIWCEVNRSLYDLQTFDSASRGPLGAFGLIWCTRAKHLASIGAFVTLLALGIQPSVQQSVSYPLKWVDIGWPDYLVDVPYAQEYRGLSEDSEEMLLLTAAVYDGALYRNVSQTGTSIVGRCPTGNCTYPIFASLGVCNKCMDITPKLIKECETPDSGDTGSCIQKVSLPNGLYLLNHPSFSDVLNMTSQSSGYDSFDYSSFEPAMFNLSLILTSFNTANQSNIDPTLGIDYFTEARAYDCIFSFCINVYGAATSFGMYQETVIQTYFGVQPFVSSEYQMTLPADWNVSFFPTPNPMNPTFTIDDQGGNLMIMKVAELLKSSGYVSAQGAFSVFKSDIGMAIWQHGSDAVLETMSNISTSLTNNMRIRTRSDFIFGQAQLETPHVHFRWPWLFLSLLTIIGTTALLVGTIWESLRLQLPYWKGSLLAAVEYGIRVKEAGPLSQETKPNKISALELRATKVTVRLKKTRAGSPADYHLVAV